MRVSSGLRVVIGDDDVPTRAAVRKALERDGCEVVAEADSAIAAVRATLALRPDITLLEVHLPGGGISAARRIAGELAGVSVVMLTDSLRDEHLIEALRVGASGYLLKDMDLTDLAERLHRILAGEIILPRSLRRGVAEQLTAEP
jgi:DNA-binding NarL/FixJ family response regulator